MNKHKSFILLLFVVIFAVILRLPAISNGLPYLYNPDEADHLDNVLRLVHGETPNERFYDYGALFFFIQAAIYQVFNFFITLLKCCGYSPTPIIQVLSVGNGHLSYPSMLLAIRFGTLLFSLATILLVYLTTKRITKNVPTSILAALFLTLSPTVLEQSVVISPNIYLGFFTMLAAYFSMDILKLGSIKYYLFAGLTAGIAAGTKYTGAAIVLLVLLAHFVRYGFTKKLINIGIPVTFLSFAVGLLFGIPYLFISTNNFLGGVLGDFIHYSGGHVGAEGNSLLFYLQILIKSETAVFVFYIIGLYLAIKKHQKELTVLGMFVAIYLIFMGMFSVRFPHHLVLALGPMSVVAACAVLYLFTKAKNMYKPLLILLIFVLSSISLYQSVNRSALLTQDVRKDARIWINKNLPNKSRIIVESYSPWVDPKKYRTRGVSSLIDFPPEWYRIRRIDYIVASEDSYGRYFDNPVLYKEDIGKYSALFTQFTVVKTFNEHGYEIKVIKVK